MTPRECRVSSGFLPASYPTPEPDLMNQLLVINTADNFLHPGTAALALYIGFMGPRTATVTA